jgi:O-acetyl-ADP-ribose deacetylase
MNGQSPIEVGSISLVKADITTLEVDAFVYYARPDLVLGAGFGTAISVRGGPSVQEELKKLGPVPVREAVLTTAGNLKARYIIHAVGPRFQEDHLEEKLRLTVRRVLQLAKEHGFKHIALPAMGAGFYAVPIDLCARVMVSEIGKHLHEKTTLQKVTVSVIDSREYNVFASELATTASAPAGVGRTGGGRP